MRRLAVVLVLAGCYRPAADQPCEARCAAEDQTCPDGQVCGTNLICKSVGTSDCRGIAGPDASESGPDAAPGCYGVQLVQFLPVCTIEATELTLSQDIDTTTCMSGSTAGTMHAQAAGVATAPPVCVFTGSSVKISGAIKVTGMFPLALVAAHRLDLPVNDSIDVGAHGTTPGPGAVVTSSAAGCLPIAAIGSANGGGGGPGGSFGGMGGSGGASFVGTSQGANSAIPLPTTLRGGCSGADGGTGDTSSGTFAAGGPGGGALYLIAGDLIAIEGTIGAGGAGGGRSIQHAGGGAGGGTGGMIVIEAPSITQHGFVYVDGGGGSGGAGMSPPLAGDDADGSHPAQGSTGTMTTSAKAGDGGNGGFQTTTPSIQGSAGVYRGGGGGGGGGVGFVVFSGTVSP